MPVKRPEKMPGIALPIDSLIKSKIRVRDLAEVYTAAREVKAMLDLIPDKVGLKTYAEATFLEPACGNGNFLIEILRRKLQSLPALRDYFEFNGSRPKALPAKGKEGKADEIIAQAMQVASTLYGFDINAENVAESRVRLWAYVIYGIETLPKFITGNDFETLKYIKAVTPDHTLPISNDYETELTHYAKSVATKEKLGGRLEAVSPLLQKALRKVIEKNIQQGDFLSQRDVKGAPLTVGEWRFIGGKVLRTDYLLSNMTQDKPEPCAKMSVRSLSAFVSFSPLSTSPLLNAGAIHE